jgi:hypothetical protein
MAFNMSVLFLRQINKSFGVFKNLEKLSTTNNNVFQQNNIAFLTVVSEKC